MPILTATFDASYATVGLVVDGSLWGTAVDRLTITRQVAGEADIPVRGVESVTVVGGTFVGSDPEAPLGASVTYRADGYLGESLVGSASATVSTVGASSGVWLKVPGQPGLTVCPRLRSISDISSPTVGGVYQIVGGGLVSQTTASWSGIESERATLSLSVALGSGVDRLRAALTASRVLLVQVIGTDDLDDGWYFVSGVSRSNPTNVEAFPQRWFTLDIQRVGIPAGAGQGTPGWSCAIVLDTYATCTDVLAAFPTCFDLLKGP